MRDSTAKIVIGDLVRMKSHVQPPHLYGVGVILNIDSNDRTIVQWENRVGNCGAHALEVITSGS